MCSTIVYCMVLSGVFWTSHTLMPATSTHSRHICRLSHDPAPPSIAPLSKNKLYKYQESEKSVMTYRYKACMWKSRGYSSHLYGFIN